MHGVWEAGREHYLGLAVNVLLYVFIDNNYVGQSIVMCENKDSVGLTGNL